MLSLNTPYDIQLAFKHHLKEVRKCQKLSVDSLAKTSGVPNSTIRKFESTGNISFRQFLMLYGALSNLSDFDRLTKVENIPRSIEEVLKNS